MGIATIEKNVDSIVHFCGDSKAIARLAAVNLVIFLLLMLAGFISRLTHADSSWTETVLLLPAPPAEAILRPWTLLTYMVTQYSVLHLVFNMLWLICFGGILHETCSDRTITLLYLAGGLTGGILFEIGAAISGISGTLCGSSAAVLAVMTAAAVIAPERRLRIWIFVTIQAKLKWVAIAMILLTFAGAGGASDYSGTLWAHGGGVIAGGIYALFLRPSLYQEKAQPQPEPSRKPAPKPPTAEGVRNVANALDGNFGDPARLDQLLDKIRVSGYNSLSRQEQCELEEISRRLRHSKK